MILSVGECFAQGRAQSPLAAHKSLAGASEIERFV
jgi:hypothetical protein